MRKQERMTPMGRADEAHVNVSSSTLVKDLCRVPAMDLEGSGLKSRYSVISSTSLDTFLSSIVLASSCSKQDRKVGCGYINASGSYIPLSLVEGEERTCYNLNICLAPLMVKFHC